MLIEDFKKDINNNSLRKKAGVAILISNKVNFQPKVIKKDKEEHFILIKGKICHDELSILNIYAPNAKCHPHS
jgi:predicted SprT family Zn-dependent metalloprotease